MSTHFSGEGNIGSAPEYREFPNAEGEPNRLLRLNVYFDNAIPTDDGYEDRGGFWVPVEIWHRDAQRWSTLYQKGMRVLISGRIVRNDWTDEQGNARTTYAIHARSVGILPYRIETVTLSVKPSGETLSSSDTPVVSTETPASTDKRSASRQQRRKRQDA